MKRALFKLGRETKIESSTTTDSFKTSINVTTWEADEDWVFDLIPESPSNTRVRE